ncbi:MAG TPA: glucoamylase family protein [Terracidiphilus sp.]|nr:glucoamylase family protein [Terracidiphilus sp.]
MSIITPISGGHETSTIEVIPGEIKARLHSAADEAAAWEVIPRPRGDSALQRGVQSARVALRKLETSLARQSLAEVPANPQLAERRSALLELAARHRMFRSIVSDVDDKREELGQLPRLVRGRRRHDPRVAALARLYLDAVDARFTALTFREFIHAVQNHEPLNVDELWSIGTFLKFALLEMILEEAQDVLRSRNSNAVSSLLAHIKGLQSISNADWVHLIEPQIALDASLLQDPAGMFEQSDFETRELYRKRIALVARRSDCSESQVAQIALELAREGNEAYFANPRMHLRHSHVGYYLIGDGFSQLASRVGFHPNLAWRARAFVCANGEDFFLTGVQLATLLFIAAALFPALPAVSGLLGLAAIIVFLLLPASQDAIDLVNSAITAFFDPEPLPKLDFSKGVPHDCITLVAIPSLLINEKQVRKLANDLEVRFLGNRDPNIHFALLTDLPDSVSDPHEKDSHPLVDLASRLIDELNDKYAPAGDGAFLLLHRHRVYNARQGVWMGWERKRGKLLDLNKLLAGTFDAFPIKIGPMEALRNIRFILTLDSDTQLPRGTAARLIGAIAHPLNQAIVDPRRRIVTAGFGILQPRIAITVPSTMRSRLAAFNSGQGGLDIYTRAVSDAYQDLFGEGIFTGKGIYEVETLHEVLNRRFPRNALLSHDLIEGAYARAGLATDIELIEDYPSQLSAYMRRKHRWVRGDWQIAQWMFSRVPEESGHWVVNPISSISRWKIFDNLRRSLVEPAIFALLIAGWLRLPGGPLYWTVATLLLLFFPAIAQLAFGLGRWIVEKRRGQVMDTMVHFRQALVVVFVRLALLPHETLLAFDAIIRSLVRRFITGERLLEWESAAQSELKSSERPQVDWYLAATPLVAVSLGAIIWLFAGQRWAILAAAPVLLLWVLANPITFWLNRPPRDERFICKSDRDFLLAHALRIWRYFRQYGAERHNFLIPDNVMEKGWQEAPRVSPTNIGLLLNTRQVACELGFLTAPEFAALTGSTLRTIERMEKFRGHLYNWYDTENLAPLDKSPFVSSVDSGNFVASLFTLNAGTRALANKPLLRPELFIGLRAFLCLLKKAKHLPDALSHSRVPSATAGTEEWMAWLPDARTALAAASAAAREQHRDAWWIEETRIRVDAILALFKQYSPWLLPEFAPLRLRLQLPRSDKLTELSVNSAAEFADELRSILANADDRLAGDPLLLPVAEQLHELLSDAIQNLWSLTANLEKIERTAERLAQDTEFAFLVDTYRQILSIGYEMGKKKRHEACYDLIASEARIATFLAIARGDLQQQSWGRLGRDHTRVDGHFLLLSWSGTMFEYLMPALWMRSYPGTLIARTQDAVVSVQRAFGRANRIPWGISESASSKKNDRGDYHYFAYGLPSIALWPEANAGPVISPYSTFLALPVDPDEALHNLRRMEAEGWVGPFGYYESADYSVSLRKPVVVREWMAHHLGMSLLAIANTLRNNVVQQWFHAHPMIQATDLLLQEIPVSKAVLKARLKNLAPIHFSAQAVLPEVSRGATAAL